MQQTHHALDVKLHQVVVAPIFGFLVSELVDRSGDDGEGCEQFVGDVGEDGIDLVTLS